MLLATLLAGMMTACVAGPGQFAASVDGVAVSAKFDGADVAAGASIDTTVTVRNNRSTGVVVAIDCGHLATVSALIPIPVDPPGRSWAGVAGDFKSFVLKTGLGPGGVSATDPLIVKPRGPCSDDALETTIAPGSSLAMLVQWTAELVDGVPAPAGSIQMRVAVRHDPAAIQPGNPTNGNDPVGTWMKSYEQTVASGALTVTSSGSSAITIGQAVDALLADQQFATWLEESPESSWMTANAYLISGTGEGIEPNGPAWDIELFREPPRTWAIGYVDPVSAKLLSITYCDNPCQH